MIGLAFWATAINYLDRRRVSGASTPCTLPELFARLRNSGYLRSAGIHTQNPGDALEQLVVYLGGGEAAIKFYHILDRRDFLQKLRNLKDVTPPKPKRLLP